MLAFETTQGCSIERATVVRKKSGPGYRLVLRVKTPHGTAAPETAATVFDSPEEARAAAIHDLGLDERAIRFELS